MAGVVWVGLDEPQTARRGLLKIFLLIEILKLTYLISIDLQQTQTIYRKLKLCTFATHIWVVRLIGGAAWEI